MGSILIEKHQQVGSSLRTLRGLVRCCVSGLKRTSQMDVPCTYIEDTMTHRLQQYQVHISPTDVWYILSHITYAVIHTLNDCVMRVRACVSARVHEITGNSFAHLFHLLVSYAVRNLGDEKKEPQI